MKTLFFSTKSYDKLYFDRVNVHYNQVLDYTETALDATTAVLTNGYDAVCTFVNDAINHLTHVPLQNLSDIENNVTNANRLT